MRKLSIRPLKLVLLTGAVILLSGVLTETVRAHGPHIWPRLHGLLALKDAITASLNANQMAAQNYASHDSSVVLNNCLIVANDARSYEHLPPYKVPYFGFNSNLNTSIPFNCKQSGPYPDSANPTTDPNKSWYLQEIDGIAIKDTVTAVAAVCRQPRQKKMAPRVPSDAFLTRICNPMAIVASGGTSMVAPVSCLGPMNSTSPNMTHMEGCAVCTTGPDKSLCHARILTIPEPPPQPK